MGKLKNIAGQKFGKLTVISLIQKKQRYRNGKPNGFTNIWQCQCECGNICNVTTENLRNNHTRSCGCLKKVACANSGGLYKTRIHGIWLSMHTRCKYTSHFKHYYGKSVCEEWKMMPKGEEQTGFFNFLMWSLQNGYQDNLTIDRIDNSKGYSPDNCRWATTREQARNRTVNVWVEYRGQKKILGDWCKELGIQVAKIRQTARLRNLTYAETFDRYLYYKYNPHTHNWDKIEGE